jgi:hypothetical protein
MLKQKTRLQHVQNLKGNMLHDICEFNGHRTLTNLFLILSCLISVTCMGKAALELTNEHLFLPSFC